MQVDPIEPTLKAPGDMLLKLRYDGPVSKFAFKFNLRRHTKAGKAAADAALKSKLKRLGVVNSLLGEMDATALAEVRRCSFTPH